MSTKSEKAPKTKTPKVPTAKALARKRSLQERKQIAAQIRSVEKIGRSFEKARETLAAEVSKLNGDVRTQLESVLNQIGIAVQIVDGEVETQAQALARTFLNR